MTTFYGWRGNVDVLFMLYSLSKSYYLPTDDSNGTYDVFLSKNDTEFVHSVISYIYVFIRGN